jgi:hypothetical protein
VIADIAGISGIGVVLRRNKLKIRSERRRFYEKDHIDHDDRRIVDGPVRAPGKRIRWTKRLNHSQTDY